MITRVWDVLHLAPPLVVTREEIDQIIDIVDTCLTELEDEHAGEIT
jgi:4-aminobutyrate aminotransferase-like enzyme